jgi:transposase
MANRPLSKNEQRRLAAALQELEAQIEAKDAQLQQITHDLQAATEAQTFDKIQTLSAAYAAAEADLAVLMDEWEHLAHE